MGCEKPGIAFHAEDEKMGLTEYLNRTIHELNPDGPEKGYKKLAYALDGDSYLF